MYLLTATHIWKSYQYFWHTLYVKGERPQMRVYQPNAHKYTKKCNVWAKAQYKSAQKYDGHAWAQYTSKI